MYISTGPETPSVQENLTIRHEKKMNVINLSKKMAMAQKPEEPEYIKGNWIGN